METGSTKLIESSALCTYYHTSLDKYSLPDFTPGVKYFLKKLYKAGGKVDKEVVFAFYDEFGTHFPVEVDYGARYTYQHKLSTSSYERMSRTGISVSAQASYSSGFFSMGGGVGMDKEKEQVAKNFQKNAQSTTIAVGAPPPADGNQNTWASEVKSSPLPVKYKLVPISDVLFDEKNPYLKNIMQHAPYRQTAKQTLEEISEQDYIRHLISKGIPLKVGESSVTLIRDYILRWPLYDEFSDNIDSKQCREMCVNRMDCAIVSSYIDNSNQCRMDNDDELYRKLHKYSGGRTLIINDHLVREMGLNELQYPSTVARITKLNIKGSYNYNVLKSFCRAACALDEQCTGYELSDRKHLKSNCRTYQTHSEVLVPTQRRQFETHIMPKNIRIKAKKSLADMPVVRFFSETKMSHSTKSTMDKCDYDCCKIYCFEFSDSTAFYVSEDKLCTIVRGYNTVSVSQDKAQSNIVGVLPEKVEGGWFNMEGMALTESHSRRWKPVTRNECAEYCARDVTCLVASWHKSQNRCYTFNRESYMGSTPTFEVESVVMFPNTATKIQMMSEPE